MKVAIYSRNISQNHVIFFNDLLQTLINRNIEIVVYHQLFSAIEKNMQIQYFENKNELNSVDFLFSIGGDGTLLEALSFAQEKQIPILGINTGRLGFLTSVSTDEIKNAIDSLLNKEYRLETRLLLDVDLENNPFGKSNYALNDVTIQKRDSSSMITIQAYLDGVFLNSYWADGLIISTPTGSTAYSMSCNGPIVLPNSGNIIITPIAPHNLNVRPLVVPDSTEIKLFVESRADNFLVAMDYKSATVPNSKEIKITKSNRTIQLVRLKNFDFLNTLRNKLMWGLDRRN